MAHEHQFGVAAEANYGEYAAPTQFVEVLPGETLDLRTTVIHGEGIRPGRRFKPGVTREQVSRTGGGSFTLEVAANGFGIWFEHMFGNVESAQPDAVEAPTVWQHVYTPNPTGLRGRSLTIQKGVESESGEVTPFSFLGSKVTDWSLEIAAEQLLHLGVTVDSRDVDYAEDLAVAEYTDPKLFTFHHGSISLDQDEVAFVKSAKMDGSNSMNVNRRFLSGGRLKAEPRVNDFFTVTGELMAEYVSPEALYAAFDEDTAVRVDLTFVRDVIAGIYSESLVITCPDVRFLGEAPKISGVDVPDVTASYEVVEPDEGEPITVTYTTTDAPAGS